LFVGAVRNAAVEEALVTAFAAVGVASQDVVQEPLHETFSSGAVEVVASAIGTLGVLILNCLFTHGTSLLGEGIIARSGKWVQQKEKGQERAAHRDGPYKGGEEVMGRESGTRAHRQRRRFLRLTVFAQDAHPRRRLRWGSGGVLCCAGRRIDFGKSVCRISGSDRDSETARSAGTIRDSRSFSSGTLGCCRIGGKREIAS